MIDKHDLIGPSTNKYNIGQSTLTLKEVESILPFVRISVISVSGFTMVVFDKIFGSINIQYVFFKNNISQLLVARQSYLCG